LRYFFLLLFLINANAFATGLSHVVVSIAPQKFIVDRLLGDLVEVQVMVTPGHNPEVYTPRVKQIQSLAKADVYLTLSLPFESKWMHKMQSVNPQMKILNFKGENLEKDHHRWLDPLLLIQYSNQLAQYFKDELPESLEQIEVNRKALVNALTGLDYRIRDRLKNSKNRQFVVFHSAFYYFAKRYDLEELAMIENEKNISARRLSELSDKIKKQNVKLMLIQKQHNQRLVIQFSKQLGLNMVEIDPLVYNIINMLEELSLVLERENK